MILDFGYLCMEISSTIDSFPTTNQEVITHSHAMFPSGKAATTAISAARMGAKVSVIGTIGADLFGKTIVDKFRREGIVHSGIAISERPTGIIQNIISETDGTRRLLNIGANGETNYNQIPDRLFNIRTLILAHDDIDMLDTAHIFKKAKKNDSRTMLYSRTPPPSEILSTLDFLICPTPPQDKLNGYYFHAPYQDHLKNEIFCGIIAACLQSNMPPHLSQEYAKCALEQTRPTEDPYPYLYDTNEQKSVTKRA